MDYSFLNLKQTLNEALATSRSPVVEIFYWGQVHLKPGEAYLQITNSNTSIFMTDYKVEVIGVCGTVLEEVTDFVFIEPFVDSKGVTQIAWEWINGSDHNYRPVCLKFTNTVSGDIWYTNPFVTSASGHEFTNRLDYKSSDPHYGTEYDRAAYYQSIRLSMYFNNLQNESEREEYHQISTDVTVSARNIRKIKDRYILHEFDEFTTDKLEIALTSDFMYLAGVRQYSSVPIEYDAREGDSNLKERECFLSSNFDDTYTWDYQIFEGFNVVSYTPSGDYLTGTTWQSYVIQWSSPVTLQTGTVRLYNSSDMLLETYTEADMQVVGGGLNLKIDVQASAGESPADGTYYLKYDAGIVSFAGIDNDAVDDDTTWTFTLSAGEYDSLEYDNNEYFA